MDKLQRIESLPDFLAAEGLEVVRGQWLKGAPYPVLFVRTKAVGEMAACVCGHPWAQHDQDGCLAGECQCTSYREAAQ